MDPRGWCQSGGLPWERCPRGQRRTEGSLRERSAPRRPISTERASLSMVSLTGITYSREFSLSRPSLSCGNVARRAAIGNSRNHRAREPASAASGITQTRNPLREAGRPEDASATRVRARSAPQAQPQVHVPPAEQEASSPQASSPAHTSREARSSRGT